MRISKLKSAIFPVRYIPALILLLLLATSQPVFSSIITNGGFETGDLTGWDPSGNLSVHNRSHHSCCAPFEGLFFINFNGGDTTPNGQLTQSFSTVSGDKYKLQFYFAKGGVGAGEASLGIEITGFGLLLNEMISETIGGGPGPYSSYSYYFIANSTNSILTFTDISGSTRAFDGLLDGVSVTSVPLPSTIWFFVTGILTLLGARSNGDSINQ
jgi:hypothetical protein